MEEDKIDRYIRRKRRELVQTEIDGLFAGVVYAESYHSELGNELGKEYPHLDYIAILNIGGKRMGFRTIHDHVDVSEGAGQYGGGGHAKASGCSLTEEAYKNFVTETFHLESIPEDARRNRYNLKRSTIGSLYKNRREELFLLYEVNEHEWAIDQKRNRLEQSFENFEDGESYLKRNYEVWLVKDDDFVQYLMKELRENKN
jgi:uncharacterized protein